MAHTQMFVTMKSCLKFNKQNDKPILAPCQWSAHPTFLVVWKRVTLDAKILLVFTKIGVKISQKYCEKDNVKQTKLWTEKLFH